MSQVPQSFHYCREDQANKYLLHELRVIIWFAVKEARTDMHGQAKQTKPETYGASSIQQLSAGKPGYAAISDKIQFTLLTEL